MTCNPESYLIWVNDKLIETGFQKVRVSGSEYEGLYNSKRDKKGMM